MQSIQIVVASRHGGTEGIAQRIARVLREEDFDVTVQAAADEPVISGYDAHLIGSGVYMGRWIGEATRFIERNLQILRERPVWLFSSGTVRTDGGPSPKDDRVTEAFGPADGPGSGGHKAIAALVEVVHPRGHRVFDGVFDPHDAAKTLGERVVRALPPIQKILPDVDSRDWPAIEAWARQIAVELRGLAAERPQVGPGREAVAAR